MSVLSQNGNILLDTGMFPPCRVATTASISLSGIQTIDGVALIAGDRVLVKDQSDLTSNGIYTVSSGLWQRSVDAQANEQFFLGMTVPISSGSINAGQVFQCTATDDPVVIGSSQITFASLTTVQNATQSATSTTSLTVGTGAKTLTVQSGKAFVAGQWVLIYRTSAPDTAMLAQVTSYSGTTLVVNSTAVGGSGTVSDWTVVLTNSPPSAGRMPPQGTGTVTCNSSVTVSGNVAIFASTSGLVIADSGVSATALTALKPPNNGSQQLTVSSFAITGITKANPCVMTVSGCTMVAGDFYFVKSVNGMTNVNFRWFKAASVSGNAVTVNDAGASSGQLVDLGALNSSGFSTYTSGGTVYPQTTRGVWTWPANVNYVKVRLWGSGAAGGGSLWDQYGGAGGSGAYIEARFPRPVGGTTSYAIDRGMPGIQADVINTAFLYAGITAFGSYTLLGSGPPPTYSGECYAYGAGVGQPATNSAVGGDGGTPGVGAGTYVTFYLQGGQGGAGPPSVSGVPRAFPSGANGAGGGGQGGNNGQGGATPGGGGAPGTSNVSVDAGFDCTASACPLSGGRETGQSGEGGAGTILLEW